VTAHSIREVEDGIRRAMGMCSRRIAHAAIREELWATLQSCMQLPAPSQEPVSPLVQLLADTARTHALTAEQLMGANRERGCVLARADFATKARAMGCSYPQIARVLHKHHTSIIHLVRRGFQL